MKIIYIASPYSVGDQATNVRTQIDAAHKLMDMGFCPIAPLLSHFMSITRSRDYEDWLAVDLKLVRDAADIVLRLDGSSAGADREVSCALQMDKPVFFGWLELERYLLEQDLAAIPVPPPFREEGLS